MTSVRPRACCLTYPGQAHTRVCEARRIHGDLPQITVFRCRNVACRVLSFDGAIEGTSTTLPCPACGQPGEPIRDGVLSDKPISQGATA